MTKHNTKDTPCLICGSHKTRLGEARATLEDDGWVHAQCLTEAVIMLIDKLPDLVAALVEKRAALDQP